jgi:hypothetical protein
MSRADRQKSLKDAYGELYVKVSRLVHEADPIGLIAIGTPMDEYDVEVGTILPRLREATSARDVQRIVHEEFVHWFSAEIAGLPKVYATVSEEIWKTWQESAARPNKGAAGDGHNGGIR